MKMRKFLSIGAVALALVSCTSIGASAEEVLNSNSNAKDAQLKLMIERGLAGENVINGLVINTQTPVGDYLTDAAINKINEVLAKAKLDVKVEKTDSYNDIIALVAVSIKDLSTEEKNAKIEILKDELKSEYKKIDKNDLEKTITSYLKVENYGTLHVYNNMNGGRTISLEGTDGNVILQINKENLKALQNKIGKDLSTQHIKELINEYAPQYKDMF